MMSLKRSMFTAMTVVAVGIASVSAQPSIAGADTGTVSRNLVTSFESFDNSNDLTGSAREQAVSSATRAFERNAVLSGGETLGEVFPPRTWVTEVASFQPRLMALRMEV